MKIILTALSQINKHTRTHPNAFVRTMTMQPKPPIKNIACFAPTEAMVQGHKKHAHPQDSRCKTTWAKATPLTDAQYTEQYYALLEERVGECLTWYGSLPNEGTILLCCYCRPGDFCHRRLLVEKFEEYGRMLGVQHQVVLD